MTADLAPLCKELNTVLAGALSGNASERKLAEQRLSEAENSNFKLYLRALSATLSNESNDVHVRNISGICLKNAIKGNVGSAIDRAKRDRFLTLEPAIRKELKDASLKGLKESGSGTPLTWACAQVVSSIARIELGADAWPDLIPSLAQMFYSQPEPALLAMAYVMEDVFSMQEAEFNGNKAILSQGDVNQLLEPLVKGCESSNEKVRISALQGFYHALNLCEENMQVEEQRTAIMNAIMSNLGTNQPTEVQQVAWDACVQLAMEYYNLLELYINDMFPLCLSAMESDNERLAISAVEFWSTICDYELYLKEEGLTDQDRCLIDHAKQFLIPILIKKLIREDEDDDGSWTLAMASSACLCLISQVLGDKILEVTTSGRCWLEDVISNFLTEPWNLREAALMAFGNILEGPSSDKMRELIELALPFLIQALSDSTVIVRETAAWTVGRIAQFHPLILVPLLSRGLMDLLIKHLEDNPRVANYVCYAIFELAGYCVNENNYENREPYKTIQPYFQDLCIQLMRTAQKANTGSAATNGSGIGLGPAAYEALSKLLCATPTDVATSTEIRTIIEKIVEELIRILDVSLSVELTDDVQRVQGYVCGCLSMAISRMEQIGDTTLLNHLLGTTLQVALQYRKQQDQASARGDPIDEVPVCEDCVESLGCVNNVLFNHTTAREGQPNPMISDEHLKTIQQIVLDGMIATQNSEYVKATVNLCRQFSTFLMARMSFSEAMEAIDSQIKQLFLLLQSHEITPSLKPDIIQVLGDLAMTCGNPWFIPHVHDTLSYLEQAVIATKQTNPTAEWREYIESVRYAVLNAYSGLLYALQSPMESTVTDAKILRDLQERSASVPFILQFLNELFLDSHCTEENILVALGLAGDLILAFKNDLIQFMLSRGSSGQEENLNILPIIEERFRNVSNPRIRDTVDWLNMLCVKFKDQV